MFERYTPHDATPHPFWTSKVKNSSSFRNKPKKFPSTERGEKKLWVFFKLKVIEKDLTLRTCSKTFRKKMFF